MNFVHHHTSAFCVPVLRVIPGPQSSDKVFSQFFWLVLALGTALAFPLAGPPSHVQDAVRGQLNTRGDAEISLFLHPPCSNHFGNGVSLGAFEGSLSFLVGLGADNRCGPHPCPWRCDLTCVCTEMHIPCLRPAHRGIQIAAYQEPIIFSIYHTTTSMSSVNFIGNALGFLLGH